MPLSIQKTVPIRLIGRMTQSPLPENFVALGGDQAVEALLQKKRQESGEGKKPPGKGEVAGDFPDRLGPRENPALFIKDDRASVLHHWGGELLPGGRPFEGSVQELLTGVPSNQEAHPKVAEIAPSIKKDDTGEGGCLQ